MKAEGIIADLYAKTDEKSTFGIDVTDGKVKDVTESHIYDVLDVKSWGIKLTTDAVLTVLKVD